MVIIEIDISIDYAQLSFQMQVEEEQRHREEANEQISIAERRAQMAQQEKDELSAALEQVNVSTEFA